MASNLNTYRGSKTTTDKRGEISPACSCLHEAWKESCLSLDTDQCRHDKTKVRMPCCPSFGCGGRLLRCDLTSSDTRKSSQCLREVSWTCLEMYENRCYLVERRMLSKLPTEVIFLLGRKLKAPRRITECC